MASEPQALSLNAKDKRQADILRESVEKTIELCKTQKKEPVKRPLANYKDIKLPFSQ